MATLNLSSHKHSSPLRSNSRRKQRQYENKIFSDAILTHQYDYYQTNSDDKHFFQDHDIDPTLSHDKDKDNQITRKSLRHIFPFHAEVKSLFFSLFSSDNADALEIFRLCGDVLLLKQRKYLSQATMKKTLAEEAWERVERRMRSALKQTIVTKPHVLVPFLLELEKLLLSFYVMKDVVCFDVADKLLQRYVQSYQVTKNDELHISFHENSDLGAPAHATNAAFYRLIVHAVCQFYGLHSQTVNTADAGKVMVIRVKREKINEANVLSNRISLLEYLLMTYNNNNSNDKGKNKSPENCDREIKRLKSSNNKVDEAFTINEETISQELQRKLVLQAQSTKVEVQVQEEDEEFVLV